MEHAAYDVPRLLDDRGEVSGEQWFILANQNSVHGTTSFAAAANADRTFLVPLGLNIAGLLKAYAETLSMRRVVPSRAAASTRRGRSAVRLTTFMVSASRTAT
jgi:hypothetical protein